MSSNQTTNYGLHQWQPGDRFLREEINENFALLDEASRVVAGCYTGDNAAERTISLGFTPKAVLVAGDGRIMSYNDTTDYGGLALVGSPAMSVYSDPLVEIVTGGFRVYFQSVGSRQRLVNMSGTFYNYIAIV